MHIYLNDKVVISNFFFFNVNYTWPANSHISLPQMTVASPRQESTKGGLAVPSSFHEFSISSHDSFPSLWEVPFLLGFYTILFPLLIVTMYLCPYKIHTELLAGQVCVFLS